MARRFIGKVALNDGVARKFSRIRTPLTFRILGDDKELWKSKPVQRPGQSIEFDVDTTAMDRLTLVAHCPGDATGAHAVWVEPTLVLQPLSKDRDAKVIDLIGPWRPSGGWGSRERRYTRNVRIDTAKGHPEFVVNDAESMHTWIRYDLKVNISRYPIAVFSYRATNMVPGWYCIWMDDGSGPAHGGCPVVWPADLVVDGKVHELRRDLRKVQEVHGDRVKKLNQKGTVTGMALSVASGPTTPAVFELLGLTFEPSP